MIPLTTKRVLRKLGGDKITNKYTFDGNIEGKEVIQMSETMFAVKISDVPIPVSELKSVSAAIGEGKGTLSAKELYIDNDEEAGYANIYDGNASLPLAVIALKDVDLGMAVTKGIYVTMDKSIGLLVYAIEFNETIHPIDPKFLFNVIDATQFHCQFSGTDMTFNNAVLYALQQSITSSKACVMNVEDGGKLHDAVKKNLNCKLRFNNSGDIVESAMSAIYNGSTVMAISGGFILALSGVGYADVSLMVSFRHSGELLPGYNIIMQVTPISV